MADQLLEGGEGDPGRDVESSIVQCSDLVMFDSVSGLTVSDGQRVASCSNTQRFNSAEPAAQMVAMVVRVLLHPLWFRCLGS